MIIEQQNYYEECSQVRMEEELQQMGEIVENLKVKVDISELKGFQTEEISLLQQVSTQFLQAMPKYDIIEYSNLDPKQRYFCSLSINEKLVAKCFEQNKKAGNYFPSHSFSFYSKILGSQRSFGVDSSRYLLIMEVQKVIDQGVTINQ